MSSDQAYVKSQLDERGLMTIEFFHPKHNSLPSDLLAELRKQILEAGASEQVSLILLRSGGERSFCAGASFDELISINDLETGTKFFSGFAGVINAIRTCGKIVLGRLQGKAVGGGVGLASAVDYAFATRFSSVKLSELNIGIGPFVIGPAVERKVGVSTFSQMSLRADQFFSPEWAQQRGLYAEVFENAEDMDDAIQAFTEFLLGTNPQARAELKSIFWEGTDHWDDLLSERAKKSGELVLSEYTKATLAKYA
jgi:methylglutaconyl-CoA hydratase